VTSDAFRTPSPILIEDLHVRYRSQAAVRGVSLEVGSGKVYALLGRNGAGKSSLIRCLLGQRRPDQGKTLLLGEDPWRHRARLMARVGVVPEEPDVPPGMSFLDLDAFHRRLFPGWDGARARRALEELGIPLAQPFRTLSKGQKGQVMLGLALGHEPELLILDDPTLGLDPVARRQILEQIIDELAGRGTTVLLTTHDLLGVEGLADEVGVLDQGRLLVNEPLETLKSRFRRLSLEAGKTTEAALAVLGPVRVKRQSWGFEAVVANFDEPLLSRLQGELGPQGVAAAALSLDEIFDALVLQGAGRLA
jgi:ABC-2 type transport system ATP-binding protein